MRVDKTSRRGDSWVARTAVAARIISPTHHPEKLRNQKPEAQDTGLRAGNAITPDLTPFPSSVVPAAEVASEFV
jgi:hypothetical protein